MKRPAFQFYPADWRKDVELQSCSMAAQGLWINAMCVAHECEPYGHLTVNGKGMSAAQLGRQVGLSSKEAQALLDELLDAGVARRTEEGTIYSKRMVEDEDLRNRRAEGGKAGSEHGAKGAEHGKKGGRPAAGKGGSETPLGGGEKPPPSSSSSSSSSTSVENTPPPTPPDKAPPETGKDQGGGGVAEVSPYAAVCIALKAAGINPVNPSDPLLRTLVDAGATADEFVAAVPASSGKGQRFAYVLATVRGSRERAAAVAPGLHRGPMPAAQAQARPLTTTERAVMAAVPSVAAPHLRAAAQQPTEVLDAHDPATAPRLLG